FAQPISGTINWYDDADDEDGYRITTSGRLSSLQPMFSMKNVKIEGDLEITGKLIVNGVRIE
ncbi:hypothetical protein, partial [Limosilactobacillus reuteri]|uniref:hypothetical protein n=1 Tax=Limosilactobacillus reuteri TaxID=1598 RepID=UPI00207C5670